MPARRGVKGADDSSPAAAGGTKRSADHIADIAQQDCKRVCKPDLVRPFTDIQDAVDRLLPFHILASEEGVDAESSREAKQQHQGSAGAVISRGAAWFEVASQKTKEIEKLRGQINERLGAADASALENSQTVRLALHTYAAAEAERDVAAEKRRRVAAAAQAKQKILDEKRAANEAMQRQIQMAQAAYAQQVLANQAAMAAVAATEAAATAAAIVAAQTPAVPVVNDGQSVPNTTVPAPVAAPAAVSKPAAAAVAPKAEDYRSKMMAEKLKKQKKQR